MPARSKLATRGVLILGGLIFSALLPSDRRVATCVAADNVGIRAPDGFTITQYAGDDLAHDIFSLTIDGQGRVVVAGPNYVKILHDDDRDGIAERASLFSSLPASGAHGMVFVGRDLICTGDNGLLKFRDDNDDGRADGPPEVWAKLRHGEHGTNGVVQGPDGWIYVVCGNDAGVTAQLVSSPASPVQQPQSGAIVRFSPDGKQAEIFAHGFRNPYDLDFNEFGQLFTVDADGERDHHLPWYAPTRLFDVQQGMHHGWVLNGHLRSWNRPAYFFDNVDRVAELGRGSPTGLVVYRHTQFPAKYRGSVLSACWTLGRVYHLPLTRRGSTYTSPTPPEILLETTGETGFAPVDLAVGPQGDLFVAIGGRQTRGGVFKVSYRGGDSQPRPSEPGGDELTAALDAPQPLAAWSRQSWRGVAAKQQDALRERIRDAKHDARRRVRAMEMSVELAGDLAGRDDLLQLFDRDAPDPAVAARALWSLGRLAPPKLNPLDLVITASHSSQPIVSRAAWETLATLPSKKPPASDPPAAPSAQVESWWQAGWKSPDRRVRQAALLADARRETPLGEEIATDLWRRHFHGKLQTTHFAPAAQAFLRENDPREKLNCVRLMELTLGDIDVQQRRDDVYAGYSLIAPPPALAAAAQSHGAPLAAAFPTAEADLNLELARLLAMLGVENAALVERLSEIWTADSAPPQDLHYLICLSRLPGPRSALATERTAAALVRLPLKMQQRNLLVSRNWPLRVGEALAALYQRDPALPAAMSAQAEFKLPAHAILAAAMPEAAKQNAARKLLAAMNTSDSADSRWTEELATLIGALPASEAYPALRGAWDDFSLRDVILEFLAQQPQAVDREYFVTGLSLVQPASVQRAAEALLRLKLMPTEDEVVAAAGALRQACLAPEQTTVRGALVDLLQDWSGKKIDVRTPQGADLLAAHQPWFDWLAKAYPGGAKKLAGSNLADTADWPARLKKIDWSGGEEKRGRIVFEKRSCLKCHAGGSPLGPSLAGAAQRFSRDDLIVAIVDPARDVAPPYQTTQVVSKSGKIVTGLIVYESPEATLVQTTPETTIRIAGEEIIAMKKSKLSLMPSGLLNGASDQELADLVSYLKTLRKRD